MSVTDFKKLVSKVQKGEKESRIAKRNGWSKPKTSDLNN